MQKITSTLSLFLSQAQRGWRGEIFSIELSNYASKKSEAMEYVMLLLLNSALIYSENLRMRWPA